MSGAIKECCRAEVLKTLELAQWAQSDYKDWACGTCGRMLCMPPQSFDPSHRFCRILCLKRWSCLFNAHGLGPSPTILVSSIAYYPIDEYGHVPCWFHIATDPIKAVVRSKVTNRDHFTLMRAWLVSFLRGIRVITGFFNPNNHD